MRRLGGDGNGPLEDAIFTAPAIFSRDQSAETSMSDGNFLVVADSAITDRVLRLVCDLQPCEFAPQIICSRKNGLQSAASAAGHCNRS